MRLATPTTIRTPVAPGYCRGCPEGIPRAVTSIEAFLRVGTARRLSPFSAGTLSAPLVI